MLDVFPVQRQLHEFLWHLATALALPAAAPLHAEIRELFDRIERMTHATADAFRAMDVAAQHQAAKTVLRRASELARAGTGRTGRELLGVDFLGADMRGADLRGANLRGACLVAADLRRADLRGADLAAADMRGADLGGADLTDCIFLTQAQVHAATGTARTRLPEPLTHPAHWPAAGAGGSPRRRK
jgi:hypothetical protein